MNKSILKIKKDIESITIQGATNVALATLKGMKIASKDKSFEETIKAGKILADARDNEPLARNAVKFVVCNSRREVDNVIKKCEQFEEVISKAKKKMVVYGTEAIKDEEVVLTHCHSSTALAIIKNAVEYKKDKGGGLRIIATETRPRYQGRKTAKELFEEGVDVTLITDSASASFIIEDEYEPVGAIIVGCDELLRDGSFINKVGTYAMARAAEDGADEFYVATTLLKFDPDRKITPSMIEMRKAEEVWEDAPDGLEIINPAFDRVGGKFVTGYITEAGVIKAEQIVEKAKKVYPWMFV